MGLFDRLKKEKDLAEEIKEIREKNNAKLQSIMNGPSAQYLARKSATALEGLLEDINRENNTSDKLARQEAEIIPKKIEA